MILVHSVLYAKRGKDRELIDLMKAIDDPLITERRWRVLSDLSGRSYTVVLDVECESLADWRSWWEQTWTSPAGIVWNEQIEPLIETSYREFYTIRHTN